MPGISKEVESILSALNKSRGHPIVIDPDGKVWTLEEINFTISSNKGKGKKKKLNPVDTILKTIKRKELLGNIYKDLDTLPIPSTSFVQSLASKKNFSEFGSPKGKLSKVKSTNFLRASQLPMWQDAVDFHPEREIGRTETRYGIHIIFYFEEEDVTVITNSAFEVRGIVYPGGMDLMDISEDLVEVAKKEVQRYKLGDGSMVEVKIKRKKM